MNTNGLAALDNAPEDGGGEIVVARGLRSERALALPCVIHAASESQTRAFGAVAQDRAQFFTLGSDWLEHATVKAHRQAWIVAINRQRLSIRELR